MRIVGGVSLLLFVASIYGNPCVQLKQKCFYESKKLRKQEKILKCSGGKLTEKCKQFWNAYQKNRSECSQEIINKTCQSKKIKIDPGL
ncbi:MAG: hypothetical protein D6767_04430 [Candidatus Hydrogenedentota bacterium]|nr:MAG: hypothetical protein D6767_04430 [Candidatus Hydrogenedentota bacterium]